jgi:hypothetical protein
MKNSHGEMPVDVSVGGLFFGAMAREQECLRPERFKAKWHPLHVKKTRLLIKSERVRTQTGIHLC